MKKFLIAAALAVEIFGGQAEAADVYVGEWEGGWKAYVMTETKRGGSSEMSCTIKTVSPRGTVKYIDYVFSFYGDRVTFKDSTGASGVFYTDSPGDYQVENEAVNVLRTGRSNLSGGSASSRPREVYVGMNDYGDAEVYILPDTIRDITFQGYSGFSVQIKTSDGNSPKVPWNFVRKDGTWCYLLSLEDWAYPSPAKGIVLKVAETANQYR